MSTITWPSGIVPSSCRLMLRTNQRGAASPFGGSEQVVDLLNDRWLFSLDLGVKVLASSAPIIEAFIASLRGQTNTVGLWHFARKVPRGTMRGTMTLSSSAAQGASALVVTAGAGQASTTLKAGDLLGVGAQLFMVQDDATANGSGVITVNIVNRVRTALSSSAAVTWNQPTVQCRSLSNTGLIFRPGDAGPVSLEFGEAI